MSEAEFQYIQSQRTAKQIAADFAIEYLAKTFLTLGEKSTPEVTKG